MFSPHQQVAAGDGRAEVAEVKGTDVTDVLRLARRRSGSDALNSTDSALISSPALAIIQPGATMFTVMFSGPSSLARLLDSPTMAPLPATYTDWPSGAMFQKSVTTLTTRPPDLRAKAGLAAFTVFTTGLPLSCEELIHMT